MPADFAPKVNHHDSASVEHGWFETLVVRASPASSPFPLEAQKVPPPWGLLHFVFDANLLFPLGVQKVQPLWASLHFVPDTNHHDFVIVEHVCFERKFCSSLSFQFTLCSTGAEGPAIMGLVFPAFTGTPIKLGCGIGCCLSYSH